jgi:hypothetical protein
MVQPVKGRDHRGVGDPGLLDDVSPIRIPALQWHGVPLPEGGPAAFVGVSHGGDANTRIASGKVGVQLPAVAGAYDYEGDLAGHVDPLWVELVRQALAILSGDETDRAVERLREVLAAHYRAEHGVVFESRSWLITARRSHRH